MKNFALLLLLIAMTGCSSETFSREYKFENAQTINAENVFRIYNANYFMQTVYTVCIDGAKYIYIPSSLTHRGPTTPSLVPFTGENTCKR